MEFGDPLVLTQTPSGLDVTGVLIGEPHEEMGPTLRDAPDGGVGKKSRGPSGPSHYVEDAG